MKLYDNSRTVENEEEILLHFQQRSQKAYQTYQCILDIQYNSLNRSTLDLFPVEHPSHTLIFIHGGYWQWCQKSDFSFIAEYLLPKNIQCILLEYALTPYCSLSHIVSQIESGLNYIQKELCINKAILVGHSAGAHLAAMNLHHDLIDRAVLLSGIYNLSPLVQTHLNDALQLTSEEIIQQSPIYIHEKINKPYHICCGKEELPELIEQSEAYFKHRQTIDQDNVTLNIMKNTNHYNILDHYFRSVL